MQKRERGELQGEVEASGDGWERLRRPPEDLKKARWVGVERATFVIQAELSHCLRATSLSRSPQRIDSK